MFDRVVIVSGVNEGLQSFAGDPDFDVILISDGIEGKLVGDFKEKIRTASERVYGYVLVSGANSLDKAQIATRLMEGFDSFLCEPYSIDDVRAVVQLAVRIREKNSEIKILSAAKIIVQSMLDEIDARAKAGTKSGQQRFSQGVRKAREMLINASEETKEKYVQMLTEACENRKPFSPSTQNSYTGASRILRNKLNQGNPQSDTKNDESNKPADPNSITEKAS